VESVDPLQVVMEGKDQEGVEVEDEEVGQIIDFEDDRMIEKL